MGEGGEEVFAIRFVVEEVDVLLQADVEDGVVDVHSCRAEQVEHGKVLYTSGEAVIELVRVLRALLAQGLALGKITLIDCDHNQLRK